MLRARCRNVLIAFVAPFFPLEAEKRYQASAAMVGLILAGYPLAVMVSAPFWAHLTPWLGRTYLYTIGSIILATGTCCFGH
jgi:MFS family permease